MVGPGTGIAPFRSFWQMRAMQMESNGKRFKEIMWMKVYEESMMRYITGVVYNLWFIRVCELEYGNFI